MTRTHPPGDKVYIYIYLELLEGGKGASLNVVLYVSGVRFTFSLPQKPNAASYSV